MNEKSMMFVITWLGALGLLVIGAIFDLDFIGMFLFVAIIFALGSILFMAFGDNDEQNAAEVEHDITQLRYEAKILHEKIDDIKRSVEL